MAKKSSKKPAKKASKKPMKKGKSKRGRKPKHPEVKLQISPKVIKSIGTLIFYIAAVLIILSFSNQGEMLQAIQRITVHYFGWGVVFVPFILVSAGSLIIKPNWRISRPTLLLGAIIYFISSISITKSGAFGKEFWASLQTLISGLGAALIFFIGLIIATMVTFEKSLPEIVRVITRIFSPLSRFFLKEETGDTIPDLLDPDKTGLEDAPSIDWDKITKEKSKSESAASASKPADAVKPAPTHTMAKTSTLPDDEGGIINSPEEKPWQFPPIDLLTPVKGGDANRGDVKANAQRIENTLESFGINAKVVDVNPGPAVTQYAIKLAIGTKLTKITSLSNDLALALAARTGQIRIEAPIPGKSLVGIELPNLSSSMVSLKELLESPDLQRNEKKLRIGLGLDVSGQPVVVDIAKMPHILVAGATGSGKSVCINVLLMSILFRTTPSEVKLILVDPKRVELSGYNGIPHLLTPVIVDPDQVVSALKWVVVEMENRYKLLAEAGVRDIVSYNEMAGFQAMPYIVIVIDELADIMLFAPSEVEDCITKIAQKARAAGIHLILATQRPSVDVITGLIKANIPTRLAFNVSSMMDSRVILDMPGAEKLLGRGDMLYIPPDQAKPSRIQGAFVGDADIKRVNEFIKHNSVPVKYTEEVTSKYKGSAIKGGKISTDGEDTDGMFEDAIRIICEHDKASASLLQRRLSIGYNRAARILDQLHAAGIIAAAQGAKPRDVLIKSYDEYLANKQAAERQ